MTTLSPRCLNAVLIPALAAMWLSTASPAPAASIIDLTSPDLSGADNGADNVPPPEISGWFVTYDPSNEWTSAANIATLDSWLATAEQIDEDASTSSTSTNDTPQLTSAVSEAVAVVPEPATLGLLGIALAILLIYVPIRRPHRSLRD